MNWNEALHPRFPKGSVYGGQFMPKEGGNSTAPNLKKEIAAHTQKYGSSGKGRAKQVHPDKRKGGTWSGLRHYRE